MEQLQPADLKQLLDAGRDICLLDVREDWEHSLVAIPGSVHIPLGQLWDRMQELACEADVVAYCHVGERSQRACRILLEAGVPSVRNLAGGIDAYAQAADPAIARYRPAM